ncbi:MAG: zf-HC2 domain-containing protein [Acidimicrobiales bacterium]
MRLFRRRPDRPMNCIQVGRRLQRYLDSDVDDLTARRIMRHLEDCLRSRRNSCGPLVADGECIERLGVPSPVLR